MNWENFQHACAADDVTRVFGAHIDKKTNPSSFYLYFRKEIDFNTLQITICTPKVERVNQLDIGLVFGTPLLIELYSQARVHSTKKN